ncbi:hypothetical protein [Patulibacter minatonensis]|uniref:hypothetical protein n=1 Tax=Patulibacter minatonensis TaxID=298163 RepID=UPI0004791F8E|nr:hypothetical protein [Patulibacter minatonensis]
MRILLAPRTPDGDAVLEHLVSWSDSGLVRPFAWAALERPTGDDPAPVGVTTVLHGAVNTDTLAEALDGVAPADVALVAFTPATDAALDAAFAELVEDFRSAAADVLVFDARRPLACTMVVAPPAVAAAVPASLFRSRHAANVYVAPEDRTDPLAVNHLAEDVTAHHRHAAHALASLAGLWISASAGAVSPLDAVDPGPSGAMTAPVRLARTFTRIVDLGDLAGHLAEATFRTDEPYPNPDPARFDRSTGATRVVPDVVGSYLEKHAEVLGLSRFEPLTLPAPQELSLCEAVRELGRELAARIRRKPVDMAEAVARKAYEAASKRIMRLAGPDTDIVIRPWRREQGFADLADQLGRPIVVPDGPVAAAWSDLRTLSVGLVDGSDLPEGVDTDRLQHGALRAVITDPLAIAPHPGALPPAGSGDREVRACDPLALDPRFAPAADPADTGTTGAGVSGATGEDADAPAGADGGADATPTDDAAGTGAKDTPTVDPDVWVTPYLRTPTWIVGAHIAEQLTRARAEGDIDDGAEDPAETAAGDVPKAAPAASAPARPKRPSLLKGVLLRSALALVVVVVLWVVAGAILAAVGTLAVLAAWVVSVLLLVRSRFARERRDATEELQRELDGINTAVLRAQRTGDAVRLERRYTEFLDWAEIVGWLVHRPWTEVRAEDRLVDAAIRLETVPEALVVDRPKTGARIGELAQQTRQQVFHTRWISDLYGALEADAMDALVEVQGRADAGVRPDPAADTSEDPSSPRRALLAAVREGKDQDVEHSGLGAALLRVLDRTPVDRLVDDGQELPSRFLGRILVDHDGISMLPRHWADQRGSENDVREVVPPPPDVTPPGGTVVALAGTTRFRHPVRVLVQRIELTDPVGAASLASVAAVARPEADVDRPAETPGHGAPTDGDGTDDASSGTVWEV